MSEPFVDGRLPEGEEKARRVRGMFDAIADRYDLVNRVMTFGMDVGWRRRAIRELRLPGGALVVDLACGTGDFCRELDRAGYRATGFDFSLGMLTAARTQAPLVQADIVRLPLSGAAVDGATCGFALRNVVSLAELFTEVSRVVRPGGRVALLDAGTPDNPVLRAGHGVYFKKVVPAVGGLLSDRDAYRYLPESLAYLPESPELLAMLRSAGFPDATRQQLGGGAAQLFIGTRG
ncbi:MAG: ubiquinone/menaquinone biosynthesis methyltransferase [Actinomycetota bacterium]